MILFEAVSHFIHISPLNVTLEIEVFIF